MRSEIDSSGQPISLVVESYRGFDYRVEIRVSTVDRLSFGSPHQLWTGIRQQMPPNLPYIEIVCYKRCFYRIPNVSLDASVASGSRNPLPKQPFSSPRWEISFLNKPQFPPPHHAFVSDHRRNHSEPGDRAPSAVLPSSPLPASIAGRISAKSAFVAAVTAVPVSVDILTGNASVYGPSGITRVFEPCRSARYPSRTRRYTS